MWLKRLLFFKKKKKKLGLALGSGGAKGMAHLGVLKAFEEEGISFDIIAGASIGSIVGGLYAKGLSTLNMQEMIENSSLLDLKKLLVYRLTGVGLAQIIGKYLGALDFSELKKPFCAVSVNVDTGEEEDVMTGDLITAMAGSSAMPPYFTAVKREGKRLIDGAFINSVPANVCKRMGADFVIGIDLSNGKKSNDEGRSILQDFYPTNKVGRHNPTENGYKFADVMLKPDLKGYHATSVNLKDEMFDVGYETARREMTEIKSKLRAAKIL